MLSLLKCSRICVKRCRLLSPTQQALDPVQGNLLATCEQNISRETLQWTVGWNWKIKKPTILPKGLRIVLTTNASFLNALAAFKSFCCTKKEYICPYTSLGTAAILSVVYKHVVRCSFGGHRWKWECLLCLTRQGKSYILHGLRLVLGRLEMGRIKKYKCSIHTFYYEFKTSEVFRGSLQ